MHDRLSVAGLHNRRRLLSGLLAVGLALPSAAAADEIVAGQDAPKFLVRLLNPLDNGQEAVALARMLEPDEGEPPGMILLDFFSLDCKPCKREMPLIQKLSDALKDKGLEVIVVSIDTEEATAGLKKLVEDMKLTLPIGLDRFQIVMRRYNADTLPYVVVLDGTGKIKLVSRGYKGDALTKLKPLVKELLGAEIPQELYDMEAKLAAEVAQAKKDKAAAEAGEGDAAADDEADKKKRKKKKKKRKKKKKKRKKKK